MLRAALHYRKAVIIGAVVLMVSIVPLYQQMGSEFMPPLYEGTILYMPTTLPGFSVTEARTAASDHGSETPLLSGGRPCLRQSRPGGNLHRPAPFSMMEVVVELKSKDQWRPGLSYEGLVDEMDRALQFPV